MQFSNDQAVYLQIMRYVREQIARGAWMPGDRLPSVRDLSMSLAVNPSTVQRAYRELEDEGLFETRRGIGSFISADPQVIEHMIQQLASRIVDDFFKGMAAIGYDEQKSMTYLSHWLEENKNKGL